MIKLMRNGDSLRVVKREASREKEQQLVALNKKLISSEEQHSMNHSAKQYQDYLDGPSRNLQ